MTCLIENCGQPIFIKKRCLCKKHYEQWRYLSSGQRRYRRNSLDKKRHNPLRRTKPDRSHPLYSIWHNINQRCHNTNNKNYHSYGACGVVVCERWRNSFDSFIVDMSPRPSSDYSIDRWPNPHGNYEPGNCRWASPAEQSHNRRDNRYLTVFGRTKIMSDWARELRTRPSSIHYRLKHGWSVEAALTTPFQKQI